MSLLDTIISTVVPALINGGGGGSNTATATANNTVTVNPQITAVNVIDTGPLQDVLTQFQATTEGLIQAGQAETRNAREDQAEMFRLLISGAALAFALFKR